MFWNNRFSVIADRWIPNGSGGERNVGSPESGIIVQEWFVPNEEVGKSGKNYVQLEDGRVFVRYDCYDPNSPYGWNEVDRKTVVLPAIQDVDISGYVSYVTNSTEDPFSWLSTREVCQRWSALFASL